MHWYSIIPVLLLISFPVISWATESRLSAAVALIFRGTAVEAYLRRPSVSFVETCVRFEKGLADDVIFGVDQELIEGVEKPVYLKGGDWMAFVGLQRTGAVWVAEGTDVTMKGTPSKDRKWKIFKLSRALQPDTWYRLRCYADFGKRQFVKLQVEGPGISESLDLSGLKLDYPNYMPFDKAAMSYYVFAMRGRSMLKTRGVPRVYFDDVKGGIVDGGRETPIFACDFEKDRTVPSQPVTSPTIKLTGYEQGRFYLERQESRFTVEKVNFAKSGNCVGAADADLQ